jgi:acetyl-CoA acyltransferase
MTDAVIVASGRSAIGKAGKGSLARTHPVDFGAEVLAGVLARVPGLDPAEIDDVLLGCAMPETTMGMNPARNIVLRAGLPDAVSGQTVNRFCASGLQTIATATAMIDAGMADAIVAGGVEHMSSKVISDDPRYADAYLRDHTDAYLPMGITAERVAQKYGITRDDMDQLAVGSHARAAAARAAGTFAPQIVPVGAVAEDGSTSTFELDEGIRPGTSRQALAGLPPVFLPDGLVTAGTSSQRSDGAGFAVVMSGRRARDVGARPIARIAGFAVAGVDPQYMGIGPVAAVPKVLARTDLTVADLDVIELNEAFAAQAIAVVRELGLDPQRVNVDGGALAMGHPLGATGAILVTKALAQLERIGGRLALVTMCIGGGMGAAAVLERL